MSVHPSAPSVPDDAWHEPMRNGMGDTRRDTVGDAIHDAIRDAEWLSGLRGTDLPAARGVFEQLFSAIAPSLWEFAARYVMPDRADDVVQEVLFAVWERRQTLRVQTTLQAYLFGAVRRKAFELARHERVVERVTDAADDDPALWMAGVPSAPDAAATLAELETALDAAIARLPEHQRTLLALRWKHGMTYEQIAEVVGTTPAAAKMQVSRMARVLRPLLERFASS